MAEVSQPDGADVTICTHNGFFHADEALAVFMLRQLPLYRNARLVRTRDKSKMAECHTVVDVGGEYDPERRRFDHHQATFTTTFPGRNTKLSSAGLVYAHFGKAILAGRLSSIIEKPVEETHPDVELLYPKIYEGIIEAIDAHDNGIEAYTSEDLVPGAKKRFRTGGLSIAAAAGRYNPNWNDDLYETEEALRAAEDDKFEQASDFMGNHFLNAVDGYFKVWLPARQFVEDAFDKRFEIDPEGRIMVLPRACAWKDWIFILEEKTGTEGKLLYVLYPEMSFKGSAWRIQCMPVSPDSFQSRKPLPEAWRGVRDEDLADKSGISGCVFVHASGFIGGNKAFEGVMEMAKTALET